ncbi:26S proteasome regulatory subunit 8 homolog A-like [Rutidosis leptorrhynchoides]|uniref:26S proteasome regulatory subunit 8 homolog A-like n=1 Tax=Rutidosis leptorrhynchoides TaxID=125765 RepID=UPI003A98FA2F
MASADVAMKPSDSGDRDESCSLRTAKTGEGLRQYYLQRIHDAQLQLRQNTYNLNRLEAKRNELNSRVRMLKEELQLLQEPGS